jgi:hypothetical protein
MEARRPPSLPVRRALVCSAVVALTLAPPGLAPACYMPGESSGTYRLMIARP